MANPDRLLEDSADEFGRVDALAGFAPQGLTAAFRLAAVAELSSFSSGRVVGFAAVAAAEGDPLRDADLPAAALHWRDLLASEERRVLGGAPLTTQRFAVVAPTLSTYTGRARLEATWRETGTARPVLLRALDAAAWAPDRALGEAGAALLLCGAGRAQRVCLLPFADVSSTEREAAVEAWRAGDPAAWTALALEAFAARARAVRRALERALRALPEEDARLDRLGRAAITARRALGQLRDSAVTTMPLLAESLELSRPAASDALERLLAAGLVRELTGRARDRVYAWEAACAVVPLSAAAAPAVPVASALPVG